LSGDKDLYVSSADIDYQHVHGETSIAGAVTICR
jgi:hypothetical protein